MDLKLVGDAERIVAEQLRSRKFRSAEAVVLAGLKSLASAAPNEFASGEMDSLLAEGEASIARDGTVDADEALAARRAQREQSRTGTA